MRAFSAAVLGLLVSGDALAQHRDPAAAEELFQTGKELLRAGDWPSACAKFEASMALDPAVGTLLKIAKCHDHDGHLTAALADYRAALVLNRTKPEQTEPRRAELEEFTNKAVAQLEPRVPRVRVLAPRAPADLRVVRDDAQIPVAAIGELLPVDPGHHEVVATASGYERFERALDVAEGQEVEVVVILRALPPPPPLLLSATKPPEPRPVPRTRRTAAIVLGGVGLATLAAGGIFGGVTIATWNDAESNHCHGGGSLCDAHGVSLVNEAKTAATLANVLIPLGSVLVAGAVVLWVTSPKARVSAHLALTWGGARTELEF